MESQLIFGRCWSELPLLCSLILVFKKLFHCKMYLGYYEGISLLTAPSSQFALWKLKCIFFLLLDVWQAEYYIIQSIDSCWTDCCSMWIPNMYRIEYWHLDSHHTETQSHTCTLYAQLPDHEGNILSSKLRCTSTVFTWYAAAGKNMSRYAAESLQHIKITYSFVLFLSNDS